MIFAGELEIFENLFCIIKLVFSKKKLTLPDPGLDRPVPGSGDANRRSGCTAVLRFSLFTTAGFRHSRPSLQVFLLRLFSREGSFPPLSSSFFPLCLLFLSPSTSILYFFIDYVYPLNIRKSTLVLSTIHFYPFFS